MIHSRQLRPTLGSERPGRLPGQARTALRMRSARPIVAGKQRSKANLRGGLFLPAEDNWLAMIMNAGPELGPG